MIFTSMAIAGAALAAVGKFTELQQRNTEYTRQLENLGIEQAALEQQTELQQLALVSEAATIAGTAEQQRVQTQQNEMAAQASAEVSAAASGVEGNSVDVTESQIEFNAGTALGSIERRKESALAQVDQMSRDIELQHQLGQRRVSVATDHAADLTNVFGAGLSGFLGSR